MIPDPVLMETPQGPEELQLDPVVRLSSWLMVRDALRCGAGAAVVPLALVGRDLAEGRLVSWGNVASGAVELWALHTTRRLLSAKVSAFLAHLARSFPQGTPDELGAMIDGGS